MAIKIQKTSDILTELQHLAQKGFSPTTLTTYIYNPIDFYQQKILGIKETEEIEETNLIVASLEDDLVQLKKEYASKMDENGLSPVYFKTSGSEFSLKKCSESEASNSRISSLLVSTIFFMRLIY